MSVVALVSYASVLLRWDIIVKMNAFLVSACGSAGWTGGSDFVAADLDVLKSVLIIEHDRNSGITPC